MTRFMDGPAVGVTLFLKRAPVYLRVVYLDTGNARAWDALDQLDDEPRSGERIVVYQLVGEPTCVHICGKGRSGLFRGGEYRVLDPQPSDESVRSTSAWRHWVGAQVGQPIGEDGAVAR